MKIMARLDIERQNKLEPVRHKHTVDRLTALGLEIIHTTNTEVAFLYKGNPIKHFPYSGWHQGKGIKAGRGLDKLLKQLI